MKLFGKDEQEDSCELLVTAQLEVTICVDGQCSCSSPSSARKGTSLIAIHLLALSILRANGKPLHTTAQKKPATTWVQLVRTVTVPLRAGKVVKIQLESDLKKVESYIFEPSREALKGSGVSIPRTVVTVGEMGRIFIPLQNLKDARVIISRRGDIGTV